MLIKGAVAGDWGGKLAVFHEVLCDCGKTSRKLYRDLWRYQRMKDPEGQGCGTDCSIYRNNQRERASTHGMSNHPLYKCWAKRKGGFAAEWRRSFEVFFKAVGDSWEEGLVIRPSKAGVRIGPGNWRWVQGTGRGRPSIAPPDWPANYVREGRDLIGWGAKRLRKAARDGLTWVQVLGSSDSGFIGSGMTGQ